MALEQLSFFIYQFIRKWVEPSWFGDKLQFQTEWLSCIQSHESQSSTYERLDAFRPNLKCDVCGFNAVEKESELSFHESNNGLETKIEVQPVMSYQEGMLDALIRKSHGVRLFGYAYHPYHIAMDLGTFAILVFSTWWVNHEPGITLLAFLGTYLSMQVVYVIARLIKSHIFGITSRSFLQDFLLILLPTYSLVSLALGNEIAPSMDIAALDLALGVSFIRIGCFLGGCCYGRPASWGILYSPDQLRSVQGCRTYSPGPTPDSPVIPMQIFESAVNAVLFVALLAWKLLDPAVSSGKVLPVYFLVYCCWRFVSDFWRDVSVRPRRAGLSEAQWLSVVVVHASGVILVYLA